MAASTELNDQTNDRGGHGDEAFVRRCQVLVERGAPGRRCGSPRRRQTCLRYVWLDPISLPHESDQTMVVATVRSAPGAHTAWHSHEHGQYLRVTQGVGRFGGRDGTIIEVTPA